jgi:hypothetical protein
MRATTLSFLAAALFATVTACTPQQQPVGDLSTQTRTTLRVDNQGFADMTIYVMRGTSRVRLGLASGASSTTFTIPEDVLKTAEALRFVADPVGTARASVSQEIGVHRGDSVTMQIPPN